MFIYQVKDPNSLISHVTISGQYLTLWQRKNNNYEMSAFEKTNSDLLMSLKNGEDFRHELFHVEENLSPDHLHLVIKKRMNEAVFLEVMARLKEANTSASRQAQYDNFFQALDEIRIRNGDDVLPPDIQERLNSFDKTTPFLAESDIEGLKKSYQDYQHNLSNSQNIFQNLFERANQILTELNRVATREKSWEIELEALNNICAFLKASQKCAAWTPLLAACNRTLGKLKNETIAEIDNIFSERESKEYPLPRMAELKADLRKELDKLMTVLQGSWHKRILNFFALPIVYMALKWGAGIYVSGGFGLLAWFGADRVNRARDWYKFDSYQALQSDATAFNDLQQHSFEVGLKSADSIREQALSLFSKAAWMHPREYYGALTSKQLQDNALIERATKKFTV